MTANHSTTGMSGEEEIYTADIHMQISNARIEHMSNRRQKIAMSKRPITLLKGCYPVAVDSTLPDPDNNGLITLKVTFAYEGSETGPD